MTIQIQFLADNADHLRTQMLAVLGITQIDAGTARTAPDVQQPTEPQIAEAQTVAETIPNPPKRAAGRPKKTAEAAPNIQAQPENRVDPATAAQDTADEQAESAAKKAETKTLTHDDVRDAMKAYLDKYGKGAETMADLPKIIGRSKVSDIPVEMIDEVIANVHSAVANNPYGRTEQGALA